jgi:hypothetical protein
MSETFSKVEMITGVPRRRRFPMDQKLAVVAETMQPGMSISCRHWALAEPGIPVETADERRRQASHSSRRGKTVAATLQVAHSNIIERCDGSRPLRAPQNRAGDVDLVADIRRLVDQRPTYGI